MKKLKKIKLELSFSHIEYVKDVLNRGYNYLSECLDKIDLSSGTLFLIVDDRFKLDKENLNLNEGIFEYEIDPEYPKIVGPIGEDAKCYLANYIHNFVKSSDNNYSILEETLIKADEEETFTNADEKKDFWNKYVQKNMLYKCIILDGKEIYYLCNQNTTYEQIENSIGFSSSFYFVGMSFKFKNENLAIVETGHIVTKQNIEAFVDGIEAFYINACDFDSYLLWEKN